MTVSTTTALPWQWSAVTRVNLGVLLIDRVGSTKESQTLPPEALSRRQTQYYAGVEEIARAYGAYDRFNWQGDGLMLLFWTDDPGSLARLVAGVGIELWQRQLDLGMQVRIAGHVVAGVEWNPDPGKLTHREINLCGHLEKDAPDGSLVISEDIYWQLPPGDQSKFGPLGESKRDATPAYCYPSGRASEAFRFSQEHALWEKFCRYSLGNEISSMRCMGFPLHKQVPRDLRVEEVFVLPNFEFVQNPALAYETALSKSAAPGTTSVVVNQPDLSSLDDSNAMAVLGRKKGLVVLGEPGSGKTTLLRWLAIVAAKGRYAFQRSTGLDERRLPLPVSVGRLAEIRSELGGSCSVQQALARYFQDRSIGTDGEILDFLEAALEKGHCLLLFDGLDEVAGNRVERWLEAFASVHPNNRYVASSRVVGYSGLRLPECSEIRLTPFSDEQVERYLRGFHRACQRVQIADQVDETRIDEQTRRLLAEIRADARLASVARNPFMLLTLALVHLTERRLPRHRVQFYQIAARTLCETWASSRRLVPGDTRAVVHFEEEALPILGALAFAMHQRYPEGVAPKEWVIDSLATALTEQKGLAAEEANDAARAFLHKAGEEAGLLCERGAGAWGFLHLTFQEYFTVAGLHAREEFESLALQNLFEPRWEEILRLGVGYLALVQGRLKAATSFVERIAEAHAPGHVLWISEILRKQIALAALLGAEVAEAMDATAKTRIFGPFLDWALDMPAEISARYLREIGVTAPDAVAPLIGALLSHAESDKRQKAAWAAGILHDDSLAEPILALLGDPVAEVRAAAARALGALAAAVAFDKLLHGLKRDPDGAVRAACAEALGKLSDQLAVPALIDALKDPNQFVVNASAMAFRGIDPRGWLSLLAAAHGSGLPPRVQAAFLAAWPVLITPTAAETLLADPQPDVRRTAIQAIWFSAERKFLPLFERVLSDADEVVRFWAVSALAGQDATVSVPLLERSARDREDFVAAVALRELAQIDNKRALDLLLERMASGVPFSEWIKVAEIDIVSSRGSAGSAAQGLALAVQGRIPFPRAKENALIHLWRFADLGPEALSQQQPDSESEPEESPGGDTA